MGNKQFTYYSSETCLNISFTLFVVTVHGTLMEDNCVEKGLIYRGKCFTRVVTCICHI